MRDVRLLKILHYNGLMASWVLNFVFRCCFDRAVASAVVYDATQEKLPKRRNAENPAWNYPRDYGITDNRRK